MEKNNVKALATLSPPVRVRVVWVRYSSGGKTLIINKMKKTTFEIVYLHKENRYVNAYCIYEEEGNIIRIPCTRHIPAQWREVMDKKLITPMDAMERFLALKVMYPEIKILRRN